MNAWGYTDVGRRRVENQDAYYIDVNEEIKQAVCVVCDGMGGANAGDIASRVAIEAFAGRAQGLLRPNRTTEQIRIVLKEAVSYANNQVHALSKTEEKYQGMGTTLVGALVSGDSVVVGNVGDSRAYLVDESGIHRVTRDHSLVEDMIQMGELTEQQAKEHPGKNLITRAVGTDEAVTVDLYELKAKPESYLLLCSDGLSNLVNAQEILYEVVHGGAPEECCKRLIEIANARGGYDNITAVLLAF